jgi:hypothetical protein
MKEYKEGDTIFIIDDDNSRIIQARIEIAYNENEPFCKAIEDKFFSNRRCLDTKEDALLALLSYTFRRMEEVAAYMKMIRQDQAKKVSDE